jgi:hypothetical protein
MMGANTAQQFGTIPVREEKESMNIIYDMTETN